MGKEQFYLSSKNIYNGTATPIIIISNAVYEPRKRKYIVPDGIKPEYLCIIKSEQKVLRANTETRELDTVQETTELGRNILLPIHKKTAVCCDKIPEGYPIVIVTSLYANIYQKLYGENNRLYTISDTVFTEDGRSILGARGICQAF